MDEVVIVHSSLSDPPRTQALPAQASELAPPPAAVVAPSLSPSPAQPPVEAQPGPVPAPIQAPTATAADLAPPSTSISTPPTSKRVNSKPPVASPSLKRCKGESLLPFFLIELWAGIASLSTAFSSIGYSLSAFCESDPTLFNTLSSTHPSAQTAKASEQEEWKLWSIPQRCLVWLVGGPSCTSLSTAGKQLAGADPTSRYLFDHIIIGAASCAALILLENVPFLIDGDSEHGLYTKLSQHAFALGYTLVKVFRIQDVQIGGFTQRERVFIIFEQTQLLQHLPAWPELQITQHPQRKMSEVLLPTSKLPDSVWLTGQIVWLNPDVSIKQGKATKCGTLRRTPNMAKLAVGDLISLKHGRQGLNKWRIMSITAKGIELRRADRKHPTFAMVERAAIRHGIKEDIPLYHPDGIGIGLRRWGEPPLRSGFAIIQLRNGTYQPRTLLPDECWALQSLDPMTLQQLKKHGAKPTDVASAAGNAITGTMSRWMVRNLQLRHDQHTAFMEGNRLTQLLSPVTISPTKEIKRVYIIPVAVDITPLCLLSSDASTALSFTISDGGRAHKPSSKQAASIASAILGEDVQVIMCGHLDDHTLAYMVPWHKQSPSQDLKWHEACSVSNTTLRLLVSLAICTALSFVPPPCELSFLKELFNDDTSSWANAQRDLIHLAVHLGARAPKRLTSKYTPKGGTQQMFDMAVKLDKAAGLLLQQAIAVEAAHIEQEQASSFLAWADCVTPLPVADISAELYLEMDNFDNPALAHIEVPDPCPPHHTQWLPRSKQPPPPTDFKPTTLRDLLTDEAIQLISDWILEQMRFLADVEAHGSKATRKSNTPLALGQDAFQPQARGIVWDLRQLDQGIISPVDFEAPIESHLNLQLLADELHDWPDQELLSFLLEGVRYKADVDYQIVLLPHLISLRDGYASLLAEVNKYASSGWYGLFSHPPFLPFRAVPKGSVPRKLEPLRPRPTTEAGAPRQPLSDSSGNPVISLNEASSGLVPQSVAEQSQVKAPRAVASRWPKENKPTVGHVLLAIALFSFLSSMLSQPLYVAADDFKNFFNQLRLAPEEFWKCGMVLSQLGEPQYAAEYIMTFGLRPASNIAQRFADAIVAIWRRRMHAAEVVHMQKLADSNPAFAAWAAARGGIDSVAARLFAVFIYTDDPIFIIVGAERMARGLRIWTQLCTQLGVLMAIPAKRQCGTHVEWLGAGIASILGVAWISKHKVVSALTRIDLALSGQCTMDVYHSLLGLLEHLVFLNNMKRNIMYHLWAPFQKGVAVEPNRFLVVSLHMKAQLLKWKRLLLTTAGVSAVRMVTQATVTATSMVLTIYSDACRETAASGIGGWFHGTYWSVALKPPFTAIPIAALEFIAAMTAILTFACLLPDDLDPSLILHVRVDALSTPYILTEDSASSPTMVALHSFFLQHPLFRTLAPHLVVSHVPGVGNEFSDAASRSDFDRLRQLATQSKVTLTQCEPSPVYSKLLHIAMQHSV